MNPGPRVPNSATATSGPAGGGQGRPVTLDTESRVTDLAHWLLSPHRDRPVVVVTSTTPGTPPPVDPQPIATEHGDRLEVYMVVTGPLTYTLADALPPDTAVFGGGARLYPRGDAWHRNPYQAPLYLCRNAAETASSRTRLRQDLDRLLSDQRNLAPPVARRQTPRGDTADGTVVIIDTVAQAQDLAQALLDPHRELPMVLVSIHPDADGPYLDADSIARDVRGAAAVFLVQAHATYGLTQGLGNRQLSVFYGAGRVYPVGQEWLTNMYAAPLHMCPSPAAAARAADRIVTDALMAGYRAGTLASDQEQPGDTRALAEALTPMGPHHVLMRTQDGRQALMLAAHLYVDVPMDRLLKKGQHLDGRLRGEGILPEFLPDPIDDDPLQRAQNAYPDAAVVVAQVDTVSATGATVHLHPQVDGTLDVGTDDDVLALLSAGDVIICRITWNGSEFSAELLDAQEPHTLTPGLSLLPGGPPWLMPQDLDSPEPEPEPEPAALVPTTESTPADLSAVPAPDEPEAGWPETSPGQQTRPATPTPTIARPGPVPQPITLDSTRLEQQLRTARDAADALTADLAHAESQLERRDAELKRMRQELRKARLADRSRKQKAGESAAPVFADPVTQLRHEIYLAFLARIPEPQRDTNPLPQSYSIGPQLVPSMTTLEGISRDKVIDVLVEVLTGLAKDTPARQLHPWTVGKSGPQEQRPDGGKAWRASLQNKTPGARRLKYWALPGGLIELDSIGHHDDGIC